MKKIRLNVANLEGTEILSREQLKSIFGGEVGSDTGSGSTCNWYSCWCKDSSSPILLDSTAIIQAESAFQALESMDCSYLYQSTGCTLDKPC